MALKLSVDKIDDVEEALRPLYVEKDGKFSLNVEGVEDTSSLKGALEKERKRANDAEKQRKAWEKIGKSPEEIQSLLDAQEEAERKKAEEAGDHAKILKQHQDKWAKDKAELEAELNAARASERGAIIGNSVMGALTKEGATEEGVDLLPDRLSNRIKFETRDGKRVLKIMQADGETPMAGSGAEGSATIDDLVKEAKQKWPSLFKGAGSSGGGTPHGSGGGGNPQIKSKADIYKGLSTDAQKRKARAAFIEANGSDAYFKLPG